jgi:hypothetical protein
MRDNYALWTAWWSVLFFWISLLFGDATTVGVFDNRFSDSRMTCWSYYSLFHLAHEDFFTRTLRTVPLYIGFCWQACVCAILYGQINKRQPYASSIPLYRYGLFRFAVIAWLVSIPLQFVFGFFTKRIYQATYEKFDLRKTMLDKESEETQAY